MPSAIPARDVSIGWPVHSCGVRHLPGGACPPLGVWLMSAAGIADVLVMPRRSAQSRNTNGPRGGLATHGADRS